MEHKGAARDGRCTEQNRCLHCLCRLPLLLGAGSGKQEASGELSALLFQKRPHTPQERERGERLKGRKVCCSPKGIARIASATE